MDLAAGEYERLRRSDGMEKVYLRLSVCIGREAEVVDNVAEFWRELIEQEAWRG